LAEFGYNGDMEFAQSSHSLYIARYHVVFVTKFRREVMNKGFAEYTRISMLAVGDEMEGARVAGALGQHVPIAADVQRLPGADSDLTVAEGGGGPPPSGASWR